jgi:hypothetical protein
MTRVLVPRSLLRLVDVEVDVEVDRPLTADPSASSVIGSA